MTSYRYKWVNLAICFLPYFIMFLHRVSTGVLALPIQEEFNIRYGIAGLLSSIYFLPYFILQIPAGLAADKWSVRKLLPISTSIIGIGGIIFAMMPSVEIGMLARAIMGTGGAFVFLPGLKTIYQWFKRSERGLAIGIYLIAPGAGSFVATGVLPFLLGLGWRYLYWVITIPVFIFAVLGSLLIRDSPDKVGLEPISVIEARESGWSLPEQKKTYEKPPSVSYILGRIARRKYTWPLVVGFWCLGGAYWSLNFWLPSWLVRERAFATTLMGMFMMAFSIGRILGSPLIGAFFDWGQRKGVGKKPVLLAGTVLSAILLYAMTLIATPENWLILNTLSFVLGILSAISNGAYLIITEMFPIQWAGASNSFTNMANVFAGFVWPMVLGSVWDMTGTAYWALMLMVTCYIMSAIFIALAKEEG